jgi:hypothetical protein
MPKIRLNKAAKMFNISLDRAVEFMNSKGFEISKDPNTVVDESAFSALEVEFQKDGEQKKASNEVVITKAPEEKISLKEEKTPSEVIRAKAPKPANATKILGSIDLSSKFNAFNDGTNIFALTEKVSRDLIFFWQDKLVTFIINQDHLFGADMVYFTNGHFANTAFKLLEQGSIMKLNQFGGQDLFEGKHVASAQMAYLDFFGKIFTNLKARVGFAGFAQFDFKVIILRHIIGHDGFV